MKKTAACSQPFFSLLYVSYLLIFLWSVTPASGQGDDESLIGRWDLTVEMDNRQAPSWLEVKRSGISTLVGQFVADGGSARPVSRVHFKDGKIHFAIPPQWERADKDMIFEGTLTSDKLTGTITSSQGKKYPFRGERAPLLKRTELIVWGNPVQLFNGKDLTGWKPRNNNHPNCWGVAEYTAEAPLGRSKSAALPRATARPPSAVGLA